MLGLLAIGALGAALISPSTDFGIRLVGVPSTRAAQLIDQEAEVYGPASRIQPTPSAIGRRWGKVTSTYRNAARNRAVGGARNSWHLSGRAIDIARRRGVSHAEIASAFRAAGYHLIESLDEGDHSHFAFGGPRSPLEAKGSPMATAPQARQSAAELTDWGIVTLTSRRGRGAQRADRKLAGD